MKKLIKIMMLAVLALQPLLSHAYGNARSEHAEAFFELRYQDASSLTTESGNFDMQADLGWGFGFSYNLNAHFNLGVSFSNTQADYKANVLVENQQTNAKEMKNIRHEADHYSLCLTGLIIC